MKFDFLIGNPPYQEEQEGDNKTFAPPIYHKFIENSYRLADGVELIHPARFLFNAGNTPKQWNESMLSDAHLKVLYYEEDGKKIFSNTDIKGGIAITYHDQKKEFGAIEIFTKYLELNTALKKVKDNQLFEPFSNIVISRTAYRLTDAMHREHPEAIGLLSKGHAYDMSTNIFDRLPQVFFEQKPLDGLDYIRILGREANRRSYKYIRRDYVNAVTNLDFFKIFLPSANGNGAFGETLSSPVIAAPGIGSTETFISIGKFETETEVNSALKYVSTKFVRALLGVLKVTQHLTPDKWKYVPLQDFTPTSDIDWSQSIADIDQQLYRKYGLDDDEIKFIETHVKEMV